jgi:hypothetical protein
MTRFLALLFIAAPAFAQSIASTPHGFVVAHHNVIQLFNAQGTDVVWTTDGVANPTSIVAGDERVAVLDALSSDVRIVELATGRGTTMRSGETPVGGAFLGRTLYLLERDARALERIGADGARASISLTADPAFLFAAGGRLYAYSRTAGVLQEITASPFAVARSVRVAPFASDVETDGKDAYLVYPREAKIRVVALATMQPAGEVAAGAVPVALAIEPPHTLAIADPSAKRVWIIEGAQSFSQAFARGFLRGLLGIGMRPRGNSDFPTGVDRVLIRGKALIAYDTSSGTLYRVAKSQSSIVAQNIRPQAFTVTHDAVWTWDDSVRRLQRTAD